MIALIVGTVLATGALAFVLFPLFDERPRSPGGDRPPGPVARDGGAVDALREIEFDRETGKLSDADYASLKESYTRAALQEMRALDAADAAAAGAGSSGMVLDAAEALVRRLRAPRPMCVSCGPRPEGDAVFCSACGRFLAGVCAQCGAPAVEPDTRFCGSCGRTLASAVERSGAA